MTKVCISPGCTQPQVHHTHRLIDEHGRVIEKYVYCAEHLLAGWRQTITHLTFLESQLAAQLDREVPGQGDLFGGAR